jgi:hypothetical protein
LQCCAYKDCTAELANARGGVFCALHEVQHGAKCHVVDCTNQKMGETQACQEHQAEWKRFHSSSSHQKVPGFRRMIRRPGESIPWQPTSEPNSQPHDENMPEPQWANYFTPHQFYCVETICAPCGVVIAWMKFANSESPANILKFLETVYPTEESQPNYICIDKACLVLCHAINSESWNMWHKTT